MKYKFIRLEKEKLIELVSKDMPDIKPIGWRLNGDEIDIVCESDPPKPKSKPKPKSESEDE